MAEHAVDPDETPGLMTRWRQTEPVRLWLYGMAVPIVAVLVGYGLLTGQQAGLWLAVVTAALLGGGTELARGFAVSPATARAAVGDAVREIGPHGEVARSVERHMLIRYRIPS